MVLAMKYERRMGRVVGFGWKGRKRENEERDIVCLALVWMMDNGSSLCDHVVEFICVQKPAETQRLLKKRKKNNLQLSPRGTRFPHAKCFRGLFVQREG